MDVEIFQLTFICDFLQKVHAFQSTKKGFNAGFVNRLNPFTCKLLIGLNEYGKGETSPSLKLQWL